MISPLDRVGRHAGKRGGRSLRALLFSVLPMFGVALASATWIDSAAAVLTTNSPEVKSAVERAKVFLNTADHVRFGGKALIGLALYKTGSEPDHPQIESAVAAIRKHIADGPHDERDVIYSLGLSLIMLAEVDSEEYGTEIYWLLQRIISLQKSHGGWGYVNEKIGDTSQTQYAVLALWMAVAAGFEVPEQVWKDVMGWLIRTQDPSGAFGYHPEDPGNFVRIFQPLTDNSRTAAALGCLYICQDHFEASRTQDIDTSVPTALHAKNTAAKRRRTGYDKKHLQRAVNDGDRWTVENFDVAPGKFPHYYMYAFERHQSFKQAVGDKNHPVDNWYDQIARHLLDTQSEKGTWQSRCGEACDTAFSVLFLIRSTRKSLIKAGKFGAGTLVGGRGLPSGDGELDMQLGRLTMRARKGPAEELLGMMDDPNHPSYLQAVRGFEALAAEADVELLDKHAARLHRLARGGDAEARVAAVKSLSRTRNLENVPTLIYALSDPDPRVATVANDGLKALSRRTRGSGELGDVGSEQRADVIAEWKRWYLVIRPDAEFDD